MGVLTPAVRVFIARRGRAKLAYYEISQTSGRFLEKMRNIALMAPNAWSSAEHGMKYLPSPVRWEGRVLIKVSYLHFHPSASLHSAPHFQIVQRTQAFRGWIERVCVIYLLIFPRLGWLRKVCVCVCIHTLAQGRHFIPTCIRSPHLLFLEFEREWGREREFPWIGSPLKYLQWLGLVLAKVCRPELNSNLPFD